MRNIEEIIHNGKTVKQILDEHLKWLRGEGGGHIADLTGANLIEANLTGANLRGANLFNVVGKEIIVFQFGQHFAYSCDGNIKIGCKEHSIEWWKSCYGDVGKAHDYSDKEIEMYGRFIDMC